MHLLAAFKILNQIASFDITLGNPRVRVVGVTVRFPPDPVVVAMFGFVLGAKSRFSLRQNFDNFVGCITVDGMYWEFRSVRRL